MEKLPFLPLLTETPVIGTSAIMLGLSLLWFHSVHKNSELPKPLDALNDNANWLGPAFIVAGFAVGANIVDISAK